MHPQIHAYLDGELPRSALSPELERELREMEAAMVLATVTLREAPVPDLRGRVMREIERAAPPELAGAHSSGGGFLADAIRWLWSPREVVLRPAYLLATAALALLLVGGLSVGGSTLGGAGTAPGPVAAAPDRLYVQFRLEAVGASRVELAGSFTDWEPSHELREVAPGVWAALVALEPGVHDYLFVVDGTEWVADPVARPVEDGFGGTNSRLFLAPPSNRT